MTSPNGTAAKASPPRCALHWPPSVAPAEALEAALACTPLAEAGRGGQLRLGRGSSLTLFWAGYSSSRHHRPSARICGSREGVRASWGWQKLPVGFLVLPRRQPSRFAQARGERTFRRRPVGPFPR